MEGRLEGASLKIVGKSLGELEGIPVGLVGAGVKINVGRIVCRKDIPSSSFVPWRSRCRRLSRLGSSNRACLDIASNSM